MSAVHSQTHGRVAVLQVDNPPVNALSHGVRLGLLEGLQRAEADTAVEAIVIIGGGRTYMAGADLKEFGRPKDPPLLSDVQAAMEASTKPIVSAIHGTALGGGLEVALTGHWRVATREAKVGLPEVKLGLTPGAGGIQRMTRLVGPQAALDIILTSDPLDAELACTLGIIDELVAGDLLTGAIAFAHRVVQEQRPLRIVKRLQDKIARVDAALFVDCRKRIQITAPGLLAPLKVIDCVEAACQLPSDDAFRFDAECYRQCLESPQRKAMIHLFFAERAAKKIPQATQTVQTRPLSKVAVIGAERACWFATCFAANGIAVDLMGDFPANDEFIGIDLVLDTRSDADIDGLARAAKLSDKIIGMRLIGPGDAAWLLEIVYGEATAPETMTGAMTLAKATNLPMVWSRGRSLVQRMLQSFRANAQYLLWQGCALEQMDRVAESFGIGPVRLHARPFAGKVQVARTPGNGTGHQWSEDAILAHLLHPLVNEGARALEDGTALRAGDIDIAAVHALGFPKFHGGPMFWGEQIGLERILATVEGVGGMPSDLLRRLANEGKDFASLSG